MALSSFGVLVAGWLVLGVAGAVLTRWWLRSREARLFVWSSLLLGSLVGGWGVWPRGPVDALALIEPLRQLGVFVFFALWWPLGLAWALFIWAAQLQWRR